MKKRIFLFTVVLLIISTLFIISASAHPGRTDANGGHWDHSTGEYHYHTGEYAGRGSSGSSSYKSPSSFKPPYDPPAKDSFVNSDSDDARSKTLTTILTVIFMITLLYLTLLVIRGCRKHPYCTYWSYLWITIPSFVLLLYELKEGVLINTFIDVSLLIGMDERTYFVLLFDFMTVWFLMEDTRENYFENTKFKWLIFILLIVTHIILCIHYPSTLILLMSNILCSVFFLIPTHD